ncbi:unnamed protein product [Fraxinus pennsylvanica]|uniref:Uncharacterized protein n=1 Tax=Fraxinus pennsylvanica TaxID=56036 RepID=A0AAD1ZQS0_9LAMI|nr:unnamed protein product [Fraxinus pennsylvanica]
MLWLCMLFNFPVNQQYTLKFKEHISAHHVWTHLTERDWGRVRQLVPSSDHDEESHVEDNGSRKYLDYELLYKAVEEGKWHSIEAILHEHQDAIRENISSHKDTALHIVILSGHTEIAEKLVKRMEPGDLELKNEYGATALSLAAICGAKKLAKEMVRKNKKLVTIQTADHEDGHLPVIVGALYGQKEMVRYLYKMTPKDELSPEKDLKIVSSTFEFHLAENYKICASPPVASSSGRASPPITCFECST